ncbi:hypothetical protein LEMLEM_LOCUS13187 [Lemmus lemmus]
MDICAPIMSTSRRHTDQELFWTKGDSGNTMRYNSRCQDGSRWGKEPTGHQRVTFANGPWVKYGLNVTFPDFASYTVVQEKRKEKKEKPLGFGLSNLETEAGSEFKFIFCYWEF